MAPEVANISLVFHEKKRIKFIDYMLADKKLIYGACIFKKPNKDFVMTYKNTEFHKKTAYQRLFTRPICLDIENDLDKFNDNKEYYIKRCLVKFGVKGDKISKMNSAATPSPIFNETYELIETEKKFKFGSNVRISNLYKNQQQKRTLTRYISNSSIESLDSKSPEIKKFKGLMKKIPKRYRYISNERDIFIIIRYDDETGELHYGASIYRKRFADDRIDKELVEKHYDTALERLIKCPVNLSATNFIEQNCRFDMNSEDMLFSLAHFVLHNENGKKRIKVRGGKINKLFC